MKGVARKSSRQLPGLESDCPPPSAPAAVCCKRIGCQISCFQWTTVLSRCKAYHCKAVTDPELRPIGRTVGNLKRLTMYGNDIGGRLADGAPTDVVPNGFLADWHHRNGGVCGQPVRLVVAAGVVAHTIEVTKKERHGAEATQTRTGET